MHIAIKWLSRILLGVLLVAVAAAAALATSPGQHLFISVVEFAAAGDDERVEFGNLEGSLFSSGRFDRIAISDRDGNWLEVHNARFAWNPFALLAGRLEVSSLVIGTIAVKRRPIAKPYGRKSSDSNDLPLIALAFDHLEVEEIALGEPVLGTTASLRLNGSAKIIEQTQGLSAQLKVARTDGPGGDLTATLAYIPQRRQLEIIASASEPVGGLVAKLLDLPGAPPLAFALEGRGPLEKWKAKWSVSASGNPFVAGVAAIDAVESANVVSYRLTSGFEGYLTSLLPKTVQPVFEGKTVGSFIGSWNAPGTFEAQSFNLNSDALEVVASGGCDMRSSHLHGTGSIRVGRTDGQPLNLELSDGSAIGFANLLGKFDVPNLHDERSITVGLNVTGMTTTWGSLMKPVSMSGRNNRSLSAPQLSILMKASSTPSFSVSRQPTRNCPAF